MDLLVDVLRHAGMQRRVLHQRVLSAAAALEFPCEKSFGFHVITQGRVFLHSPAMPAPVELRKGDVALMARGCRHVVASEAVLPGMVLTMGADGRHAGAGDAAQGESRSAMVSGAYQVWNTPVHPFFSELPPWYVLRADEAGPIDQIELAVKLLAHEVARPEVGSETVTQALLDIIFTQIIRKILSRGDGMPQSWGGALQNAQIRAALELMHGDCAHEWTLEELARRVGLSRAGFAQKFKLALGTPPLQYLTTLRVQKAMDLLSNTGDKLEAVSQAVGYRDAFSFSKAFKKLTGIPPKEFRLRDHREKGDAWRFQ
ncbi:AraC family transcriptional regulator [Noviherbaspirillum galbum]|uniref:AraC family transcriptional regulator n=1 Tax=Noviherbaspirillum galbum TaxID=2709383 RepID=A0A6B3SJM1_9BURK|nr:AraC family transcriptional regulator [Noviherbaspirillum galbum]NEX61054.1 AraC family transcriptional regulator [Noviherbaspirillum galbum]